MSTPDVHPVAANSPHAVPNPHVTLPDALTAHAARVSELLPGLRLHADDQTDPVDGAAQGQCPPGLHLVLLLEGGMDVSYGQRRVQLATGAPGAAGSSARSPRGGGS